MTGCLPSSRSARASTWPIPIPGSSAISSDRPWDGVLTTWLLFVLVIEGVRAQRRHAPLVIVVLAFIAYALVGHLVGGSLQTREVQLSRMIFYLGVDTSGLFGLVLLIGVTVVVPFVFFGQLLSSSGGANFFNDLSLGLMGRFRGGRPRFPFSHPPSSARSTASSSQIFSPPVSSRSP